MIEIRILNNVDHGFRFCSFDDDLFWFFVPLFIFFFFFFLELVLFGTCMIFQDCVCEILCSMQNVWR